MPKRACMARREYHMNLEGTEVKKQNIDIESELKKVEQIIESTLGTWQDTLSSEINGLLKAGGKRLRPTLLLLSGQFGRYDNRKLLPLAAGIEMLHMATLIHDDIIDDADIRRGIPTTQRKWGSNIAIFTGDFLFTQALTIIASNIKGNRLDKVFQVMKSICEGEVDQYRARFDFNISVTDYLRRIARKTALLFSLSCRIGAEESGCSYEDVWHLKEFGKNLGMAFQIQDDILDFVGKKGDMGKSTMEDFINGIFTLPLIHTIKKSEYRNRIVGIVERGEYTQEELDDVKRGVFESGGIDYSEGMALRYVQRAISNLKKLPAISIRENLMNKVMGLQFRKH